MRIEEVEKCEDCPLGYLDMEDGYYCTLEGTPQDRKWQKIPGAYQDIPDDCPLKRDNVTIQLKQ